MGIDGIGKGGLPPGGSVGGVGGAGGTSGAGGASGVGGAEKTFSVEKPDAATGAAQAGAAGAVDPSSPLARLRAGEIDVHGYVDAKVDEATRGIDLPPSDLADLKALIREQMVTDPSLVDLVRQSTGHAPTPPED